MTILQPAAPAEETGDPRSGISDPTGIANPGKPSWVQEKPALQLPNREFEKSLRTDLPTSLKLMLVSFQDVFPQSLPAGLPPERAVDHKIELEPEAIPPSRPTYRLSHKELEELHT